MFNLLFFQWTLQNIVKLFAPKLSKRAKSGGLALNFIHYLFYVRQAEVKTQLILCT
jgi:hypothetical protein